MSEPLKRKTTDAERAAMRDYYLLHRERIKERERQRYIANREEIRAKRRLFYQANRDAIIASVKAYHSANSEKRKASQKAYRAKQPRRSEMSEAQRTKLRAFDKKYHVAHKAEEAAAAKKRRQSNPELRERLNSRARTPEKRARQNEILRWRWANDPAFRERRKASWRGKLLSMAKPADRPALTAFYRLVREAESLSCYWCGVRMPRKPYARHVDHIVPLASGGTHAVLNLCASCPLCNQKKGKCPASKFSQQLLLL